MLIGALFMKRRFFHTRLKSNWYFCLDSNGNYLVDSFSLYLLFFLFKRNDGTPEDTSENLLAYPLRTYVIWIGKTKHASPKGLLSWISRKKCPTQMSLLHFANLIFFKTQLMFCLACYYSYQELLMEMQSCSASKYSGLTDVTRISIKE